MLGLPEMFVDDVVLDGISVYMDAANSEAGYPAMAAGVADMCRARYVLKNAEPEAPPDRPVRSGRAGR